MLICVQDAQCTIRVQDPKPQAGNDHCDTSDTDWLMTNFFGKANWKLNRIPWMQPNHSCMLAS
jgi:hypothetical protein